MENKMMMPANYNSMTEEEMVYTCGGESSLGDQALAAIGIPSAIIGLVSVCNMIWGVSTTRTWIQQNKTSGKDVLSDAVNLATKGIDATISYASKSVWNAITAVYTTSNLAAWWPVTAIAWVTA